MKHNIPFVATSKGENRNPDCPNSLYFPLEITDQDAVFALLEQLKPDAVIHTAALTNVDYCEDHPEECQLVNVDATRFFWEACKKHGAHFELLSTDFVFDGEHGPYKEEDSVNPLSLYAKSKVDAEMLLLEDENNNWSIARTIIVYGTGHGLSRSNMILWALEALPKGQPMKLVNDQFRAPTWADDLAYGCLEIVLRGQKGIFHLSGPVTMSVDKIVTAVAEALCITNPVIEVISSSTLNQAAKRPPKTGFVLDKARELLGYKPKTIQETIPILLSEMT
jgi:dTDP-4-dehydrorhamnose reductase